MKLNTIKELYDKVQSGDIDESKLEVTLDNDCTSFYIIADNPEEEPTEIRIYEVNGYDDIEPLYRLLFPKAKVQWC